MRPLLLISCAILLADNSFGASQLKLGSKPPLNYGTQGQDEYYVPSYFNPYQSYQQPYPLLTQLEVDPYEFDDQQQIAAPASKFPSFAGQSIALNGPDSLTKYKPDRTKAKQINADFRNLLANIKAIQPVVDQRLDLIGKYIKASSQRAAERARQSSSNKAGQVEYSEDAMKEKLLPYQAEGMVSSEDEIQEASDLDKRQHGIDLSAKESNTNVREPKARRKLVNEPSMLQNDRNMVLAPKAYHQSIDSVAKKESILGSMSDVYFVAIVACISSVAIFSVIGAGYCFYKVQQSNKAAQDVEFPAYGVIGPASRGENNGKCSSPPSDRKLAQSAQMYHYHHQKQQMISNEKNASIPRTTNGSDVESDEENEDGEYTVYECPGLAPTCEMEVKNPLFQDDLTPMSSPSVNGAVKQDSPKVVAAEVKGAAAKSEQPK